MSPGRRSAPHKERFEDESRRRQAAAVVVSIMPHRSDDGEQPRRPSPVTVLAYGLTELELRREAARCRRAGWQRWELRRRLGVAA